MEPIVEKDNVREQSHSLTLELISFEQFLEHQELRSLEHEMFRLKITQLTILHCNNKISYIFRENQQRKSMHKHIMATLQKIVVEGLLYLLKVNLSLTHKLSTY
jgi:hypothetical protein